MTSFSAIIAPKIFAYVTLASLTDKKVPPFVSGFEGLLPHGIINVFVQAPERRTLLFYIELLSQGRKTIDALWTYDYEIHNDHNLSRPFRYDAQQNDPGNPMI